jgi:hypothetical protein
LSAVADPVCPGSARPQRECDVGTQVYVFIGRNGVRLNHLWIATYNEGKCAWVHRIESIANLMAGRSLGDYRERPHWDARRFSPYCRFPVWFYRFDSRPVYLAQSSI